MAVLEKTLHRLWTQPLSSWLETFILSFLPSSPFWLPLGEMCRQDSEAIPLAINTQPDLTCCPGMRWSSGRALLNTKCTETFKQMYQVSWGQKLTPWGEPENICMLRKNTEQWHCPGLEMLTNTGSPQICLGISTHMVVFLFQKQGDCRRNQVA